MRNRIDEMKAQGSFNANYHKPQAVVDFGKIKIGAKTLDDATYALGSLKKVNPRLADKDYVLNAIDNYDLKQMREISDFFFKTSGIYSRIVRYMAFMYRYDWYVTVSVRDKSSKKDKVIEGFWRCLDMLDNFRAKESFRDIAEKVIRYGAYYGYKVETSSGIVLQELPLNYCRSRYSCNGKPAVEFNMKYFDDAFRDLSQRMRILKMFPPEFTKGYQLYKAGKLVPDAPGDSSGWYLLDPKLTARFTASSDEFPMFISVVPLILDLDEAQDIDRKRTIQRLLKIIIQKMPMDKNGELIFDPEEAQQLHNNAVQMVGKAVNVDVLTTFADVEVADLANTSVASAQTDDLERVERQVFNEAGVSQKQFNTDGNVALEKSILNDEATMTTLMLQFESFLNELIVKFNNQPKKFKYKAEILGTTVYNYKEMAKLYKEQVTLGYSKILSQVALGHSQSNVLSNPYFENEILDLVNVFIPPLQSSTMNADSIGKIRSGGKDITQESKGGRPEKPDDQKSEKTIQNKESQS